MLLSIEVPSVLNSFLLLPPHAMTTNTSRTPILDQCLAIRNLLALSDHELEQIINLKQEKEESLHLPDLSSEEREALSAQYDNDIQETHLQYESHYTLRKQLQSSLFTQYDIDLSYRCQFKHKLTIQESLKEIADATQDPQDRSRFHAFTKDLYLRIGKITGLWHTPCGRCLLDAETKEDGELERDSESERDSEITPASPVEDFASRKESVLRLARTLLWSEQNIILSDVTFYLHMNMSMYPFQGFNTISYYIEKAIENQNELHPNSPLTLTDPSDNDQANLFEEAIRFAYVYTFYWLRHADNKIYERYFMDAFDHLRRRSTDSSSFDISKYSPLLTLTP